MEYDKKKVIEQIKLKLWRFAYSVKDFSETKHIGFDLLVEGKFRLNIVEEWPERFPTNCDVIAFIDEDGDEMFVLKEGKKQTESESPYKIFGKK